MGGAAFSPLARPCGPSVRSPACTVVEVRSSVRKFLASECMAAMGVSTTRALALVASRSERTQRPWSARGARHASKRITTFGRKTQSQAA